MYGVVALACLFALCAAQPPRPQIPETFYAQVSDFCTSESLYETYVSRNLCGQVAVELHSAEGTIFGRG